MGLATDSLDNFKKAIDEGNTAPLADMLADNVIFENTECEQQDKATVLANMGWSRWFHSRRLGRLSRR